MPATLEEELKDDQSKDDQLKEEAKEDQRRPYNRRPDGPYPELAAEIARLMGHGENTDRNYLSTRMAEKKTGVTYNYFAFLLRGRRVGANSLIQIAKGLRGDPLLLLRLAGYTEDQQVGNIADQAENEIIAIYREFDQTGQDALLAVARALRDTLTPIPMETFRG